MWGVFNSKQTNAHKTHASEIDNFMVLACSLPNESNLFLSLITWGGLEWWHRRRTQWVPGDVNRVSSSPCTRALYCNASTPSRCSVTRTARTAPANYVSERSALAQRLTKWGQTQKFFFVLMLLVDFFFGRGGKHLKIAPTHELFGQTLAFHAKSPVKESRQIKTT